MQKTLVEISTMQPTAILKLVLPMYGHNTQTTQKFKIQKKKRIYQNQAQVINKNITWSKRRKKKLETLPPFFCRL